MKKSIVYLMLVVVVFCYGYIVGNYKKNSYDVNNDGKVNSKDLLLVQKHLIEEGK